VKLRSHILARPQCLTSLRKRLSVSLARNGPIINRVVLLETAAGSG